MFIVVFEDLSYFVWIFTEVFCNKKKRLKLIIKKNVYRFFMYTILFYYFIFYLIWFISLLVF